MTEKQNEIRCKYNDMLDRFLNYRVKNTLGIYSSIYRGQVLLTEDGFNFPDRLTHHEAIVIAEIVKLFKQELSEIKE
jgi:hypothetical protein